MPKRQAWDSTGLTVAAAHSDYQRITARTVAELGNSGRPMVPALEVFDLSVVCPSVTLVPSWDGRAVGGPVRNFARVYHRCRFTNPFLTGNPESASLIRT
jgi:hypothetical protein